MRDPNFLCGYYGLLNFDADSTYAVGWFILISLFFIYEKSYGKLMEYGVNLKTDFTVLLQTLKKDGIAFQRNCEDHPLGLDY